MTVTLTRTWGCGHGFWVSDQAETVGLLISPAGRLDQITPGEPVPLPNDDWTATILLGERLFTNWCNDVLDESIPQPVITAELQVIGGSIVPLVIPAAEIACQAEQAALEVRGLIADGPDGSLLVPDMTIVNDTWGCFAG